MFDWFWEFLYSISKSIFKLIDGLMSCANVLLGIDPVYINGKESNMFDFLMTNSNINLAFVIATIIAVILVSIFGVVQIIRTIISEKVQMSPTRVVGKVGGTILTFIFIPLTMALLIFVTNIFMKALFQASLGGTSTTLGSFLVGAFSQDALNDGVASNFYTSPGFDYTDTATMWNYIDLSDFDYFFSWVAGICILFCLAKTLLLFVDRAIAMVILYIVAPISLSASVVDDGAHFKLWRDQFLVKFLTGYGCILGLNIYAVIVGAISNDNFKFFQTSLFLNNLLKLAFIIGGAMSMSRIMALVGNLVSAGAGSRELADTANANRGFAGAMRSIGSAITSPFRATRSAINFAQDAKQYGVGGTIANRFGFKSGRDYGQKSELQKAEAASGGNQNPDANGGNTSNSNAVANVISGGNQGNNNGNNNSGGQGGSNQSQQQEKKQNPIVANAISNAGSISDKSEAKK